MFPFYRIYKDNGNNGDDRKIRYRDMLFNAIVIGGIAFFSTWNGHLDIQNLLVSLKAFGLSFFLELAYEKGLKRLRGG